MYTVAVAYELYVISYLLPVNGRHLRFPTCLTDIILTSLSVLPGPENMGIAVGILLLSGTQAKI